MKPGRGRTAQQLLPPPAPAPVRQGSAATRCRPAAPAPAPAAPVHGPDRGYREAARSARQRGQLARLAVWALVASGPLLGLAALAARTAPTHTAAATAAPTDTTGAAGIAEVFLQTYLAAGQGTESAVRVYYPAYPDQTQQPDQREAEAVEVLASRSTSPGVVTVELAAHVMGADSGGWRDLGWHYYQVPIAQSSGTAGYLALSLPAEVQAPAELATEPNSAYTDNDAPTSGTPLSSTVAQFLAAYLAGQGALSRYTVPGSTLAAISPAPYTSVTLSQLSTDATSEADTSSAVPAAGSVRHVLAEVTVTDTAGYSYQLAYPLVLQVVAGQWEVSSLAPAPDLAAAPSAALASPAAGANASSPDPTVTAGAGQGATDSAAPSSSAAAAGTTDTAP